MNSLIRTSRIWNSDELVVGMTRLAINISAFHFSSQHDCYQQFAMANDIHIWTAEYVCRQLLLWSSWSWLLNLKFRVNVGCRTTLKTTSNSLFLHLLPLYVQRCNNFLYKRWHQTCRWNKQPGRSRGGLWQWCLGHCMWWFLGNTRCQCSLWTARISAKWLVGFCFHNMVQISSVDANLHIYNEIL